MLNHRKTALVKAASQLSIQIVWWLNPQIGLWVVCGKGKFLNTISFFA
jgi:hypothetical protein